MQFVELSNLHLALVQHLLLQEEKHPPSRELRTDLVQQHALHVVDCFLAVD